ncbi:MAG: hypothetical protein HC806_00210 [Anaerolineae bacterium]|nr:hypothetical protein [Anaerolineae bacterium]
MKPSIDKLYKFLKLEIKKGYDNSAVMGGLQVMPGTWENEARADDLPESLIRAVHAHLRDYHQLTVKSREDVLFELWDRVKRSIDEPLPELTGEAPPAPPQRARPEPKALPRVENRKGKGSHARLIPSPR